MEFTWHDRLWTLDFSYFGFRRSLLTRDGSIGIGPENILVGMLIMYQTRVILSFARIVIA